MRKALSFLAVSVLLLLVALSCSGVLASRAPDNGETGCALIIALLAGFAFVIWPVEASFILFAVPALPFVALGVVLTVVGFAATVAACGIELLFPLLLGVVVANAALGNLGGIVASLFVIIFLAVWIYFWHRQRQFIRETWRAGGRLFEQFVKPIFNEAGRVLSYGEKVGQWVKGE